MPSLLGWAYLFIGWTKLEQLDFAARVSFFSHFFFTWFFPSRGGGGGCRIERLSWAQREVRQAQIRQLLQVTGLSLAHVLEMVAISTASPYNLGSYQCSLRLNFGPSIKNLIYHLKPHWARCTWSVPSLFVHHPNSLANSQMPGDNILWQK